MLEDFRGFPRVLEVLSENPEWSRVPGKLPGTLDHFLNVPNSFIASSISVRSCMSPDCDRTAFITNEKSWCNTSTLSRVTLFRNTQLRLLLLQPQPIYFITLAAKKDSEEDNFQGR